MPQKSTKAQIRFPDFLSFLCLFAAKQAKLCQVSDRHQKHFLPAAGHDLFLPLYDPLVSLLGAARARRELIKQANLQPGQRILDLGCGTGTMVIMLKRQHPQTHVLGLDPDPKALARARRKVQRASVLAHFDQGFSDQLPYKEALFDRVFSSFMFHHLEGDDPEKTLREVLRVLKPDGSFHLLDFAGGENGSHLFRLHVGERLKDYSEDHITGMMRQVGLKGVQKTSDGSMFFGLLRTSYYEGHA